MNFIKRFQLERARKQLCESFKQVIELHEAYLRNLYVMGYCLQALDKQGAMSDKIKELSAKLYDAINQCDLCIRRTRSVVESLNERDYRYLAGQIEFAWQEIARFQNLSDNVLEDIMYIRNNLTPQQTGVQEGI